MKNKIQIGPDDNGTIGLFLRSLVANVANWISACLLRLAGNYFIIYLLL